LDRGRQWLSPYGSLAVLWCLAVLDLGAYGGKGVPISVSTAALRYFGWVATAHTAYDVVNTLRTKYKACMEGYWNGAKENKAF
jgi:hypothetical protein